LDIADLKEFLKPLLSSQSRVKQALVKQARKARKARKAMGVAIPR